MDNADNTEIAHTVAMNIVRTNARLIALTQQYEQNGRDAHLMTAALKWANLGVRIHNATFQRIGTSIYFSTTSTRRAVTRSRLSRRTT